MSKRNVTGSEYAILKALMQQPSYGYAIGKYIAAATDRAMSLSASTIYDSLRRLQGDGLVEPDRETVVGGRVRKAYKITRSGRRVAAERDKAISGIFRIGGIY